MNARDCRAYVQTVCNALLLRFWCLSCAHTIQPNAASDSALVCKTQSIVILCKHSDSAQTIRNKRSLDTRLQLNSVGVDVAALKDAC